MGRLYSGNLNAFKDAVKRLQEDHDVGVLEESYRYEDPANMRWTSGETLSVTTRSGSIITSQRFEQYDEDVRCNAQTDWLRKVHSDLKHWK